MKYGINNSLGMPSIEESIRILNIAKKCGIKRLDTADAYGESQKIIGAYHQRGSSI